ncbi:uncharacterized protein LOC114291177 [Camellia sinensis]|uniref:uncharacterized protein LOC114291177 n=1 Tax=Camellia sinensis TaxID=4442 RepID=UPI0010356D9E|nr:uncharacterized protein LOC114291177 [Camellia sinensis]
MEDELFALQKTNTWALVPLPAGKNLAGCKWVYKVKTHSDSSLERYKARLVAKGFSQEYGIDYDETFALVAKITIVRTLIFVTTIYHWPLYQMDIKNDFLNGHLTEEVYMCPHPGLPHSFGQAKYADEVIHRASLTDTKVFDTPTELNVKLNSTDGVPVDDPISYRGLVDCLVYLTVTCPDLVYVVHVKNKKQTVVARSTVETEYRAVVHTTAKIHSVIAMALSSLFFPYSIDEPNTVLDNKYSGKVVMQTKKAVSDKTAFEFLKIITTREEGKLITPQIQVTKVEEEDQDLENEGSKNEYASDIETIGQQAEKH